MKLPTMPDEDGDDIPLPHTFEVCPQCRGHGTSSAHLGSFTQSEWDEQGPEFQEDYMRGFYDRQCDVCDGERVVPVVDESRMSPELLKQWRKHVEFEVRYREMCEMERRMGA